jgi:hypothetical protein
MIGKRSAKAWLAGLSKESVPARNRCCKDNIFKLHFLYPYWHDSHDDPPWPGWTLAFNCAATDFS